MGIVRRSGYTALLSYIGFFIGYGNMLWLFPYAFRPEEIGLIRLLLAVAALFATLFSLGGSQVAIKFFPYFSNTIQRRSAFFKIINNESQPFFTSGAGLGTPVNPAGIRM